MREKRFVIPVTPMSSKKPVDKLFTETTHNKLASERRMLEIHLKCQMNEEPAFTGPLAITFGFYMNIPCCIKDRKPYPMCQPVIGKFINFYCDLLLFCNIIQKVEDIVEVGAKKRYAEKSKIEIFIKEIDTAR